MNRKIKRTAFKK